MKFGSEVTENWSLENGPSFKKTYFLKVVAKFDKDHFSFYDFFCQSPHCAASIVFLTIGCQLAPFSKIL